LPHNFIEDRPNDIKPNVMRRKRSARPKQILIIAGPNGAGKTTFAQQFLPKEAQCPDFINADLIAKGLSPFEPEKASLRAGKIMLAEMHRRVQRGESFAFETTLSGLRYALHIARWKKLGYRVKLIFLKLPSVEIALARVAARVAQGGHSIPTDVVRRRFDAGLRNLENVYCRLVDEWELYDNAGAVPKRIRTGSNR
jgi:predicted ABC-type ATPase